MQTVKCTCKTSDDAIVTMKLEIATQILNFEQMYYSLASPIAQVRAYVEDSLRGRVAHLDVDELFKAKQEVADLVRRNLQEDLQPYGIKVIAVLTTDIKVNKQVKAAMTKKELAKREVDIALDEAERDKVALVKKAEAQCEANEWHGLGTAKARKNILDGVRESIQGFHDVNPDISQQECYDTVLLLQYLQTLANMRDSTAPPSRQKGNKKLAALQGPPHPSNSSSLVLPIGGGCVETLLADLMAQQSIAAKRYESSSEIAVVHLHAR